MNKVKPSLPSGTRDFGPAELRKRNYIFGIIKNVFEKYGYQPIETPAMEKLEVLEGKSGNEGDKLLFRILNSGDPFKELSKEDFKRLTEIGDEELTEPIVQKYAAKDLTKASSEITNEIQTGIKRIASRLTEKGLRYDLTIPFARYVVQHQNEITFPFKRYQIQPVWRADRPQKGRYREFYQCDADVIGSDSLLNEAELIMIYSEVFSQLGFFDFTIKINNRKILKGLAETLGSKEDFSEFTMVLDKLDKIGFEKVVEEWKKMGVEDSSIDEIKHLLKDFIPTDSNEQRINELKEFLKNHPVGLKGVEEVNTILDYLSKTKFFPIVNNAVIDLTLARGLDYYTGTIFEVKANNVQMGSIGGGGRYDNLTGVFGLPNVSGVGISFGVERIYDVMEELKLFDNIDLQSNTTRALFINFGGEAETKSFQYLQQLRANDIPAEIYPSNEKMKKQVGYADKKGIPYAIFVGEEELKNNTLQVKNLKTGEQTQHSLDEVIEILT